MVELTHSQERRRAAVETLIKVAEPGLNLILAVGDRLSRLVEPEDHEYYPARPLEERLEEEAAGTAAGSPPRPAGRSRPAAGRTGENGSGAEP